MKQAKIWMLGMATAATLVSGASAVAKEADKDKEDIKPKMGPRKVLTQFDTNKNGKIDGNEVEELRKAFAGDLKAQLAKLDKDGNGKLDDAEIAAIKPKAAPDAGGVVTPKKARKAKKPAEDAPAK